MHSPKFDILKTNVCLNLFGDIVDDFPFSISCVWPCSALVVVNASICDGQSADSLVLCGCAASSFAFSLYSLVVSDIRLDVAWVGL